MQCCVCWDNDNLINLECHSTHNLCLTCLDSLVYKPILKEEDVSTECPLCRTDFSHILQRKIRNSMLPFMERLFFKSCVIFVLSCWSIIFVSNTQAYIASYEYYSEDPIPYYRIIKNFRFQVLTFSVFSFLTSFVCIVALYRTCYYNLIICKTLLFIHHIFLISNPLFFINDRKIVPLLITLYTLYDFRKTSLLLSRTIYFLHFAILF